MCLLTIALNHDATCMAVDTLSIEVVIAWNLNLGT